MSSPTAVPFHAQADTPNDSHSDGLSVTPAGTRKVIVPMRSRAIELVFNGKEVTEFLDDYDRMADNGGLSDIQKIRVLPDYCEEHCRRFVKRLKPYGEGDWIGLQLAMKEHWKDQDTSQRMGSRVFYYTNFVVYSDACQKTKQVLTNEEGYFFFLGLPKTDKDLVLFNMIDGPSMKDRSSFHLDKIYEFVKRVHEQRQGLRDSSFDRSDGQLAEVRKAMDSTKDPTDFHNIVDQARGQIASQTATARKLPEGVGSEVDELVKAMEGWKLSLAEVSILMESNPEIRNILKTPTNYAYFVAHATTGGIRTERNDGSSREGNSITPATCVGNPITGPAIVNSTRLYIAWVGAASGLTLTPGADRTILVHSTANWT